MGIVQSIPTSAAVATAVVGAAALGYYARGADVGAAAVPAAIAQAAPPASSAKKSKKKKAPVPDEKPAPTPAPAPRVVAFPEVVSGVPGALDADDSADADAPKPKKKKAAKPKPKKAPAPAPAAPAAGPSAADAGGDDWTQVPAGRRRGAGAAAAASPATTAPASDAGVTTSATGTSTPTTMADEADAAPDTRRTLAEKLLPKARKTGVDDMLETPDHPTLARVMRVAPAADTQPAAGFSADDYEDVGSSDAAAPSKASDADDDDGWDTVKARRPVASKSASSTQGARAPDPGEQTKKQRQNAAKREAQKAAAADAEAARLAQLARHKRELERARIAELHAGSSKGRRGVGNGMAASVDAKSNLVFQ